MKNKGGYLLKELREQMNLSQLQLSEMLNISNKVISSAENLNSIPTKENRLKLNLFFKTEIF